MSNEERELAVDIIANDEVFDAFVTYVHHEASGDNWNEPYESEYVEIISIEIVPDKCHSFIDILDDDNYKYDIPVFCDDVLKAHKEHEEETRCPDYDR